MVENKLDELRVIEKRIVQMWLMYPDTKCYVESENNKETVIKVVVKK